MSIKPALLVNKEHWQKSCNSYPQLVISIYSKPNQRPCFIMSLSADTDTGLWGLCLRLVEGILVCSRGVV